MELAMLITWMCIFFCIYALLESYEKANFCLSLLCLRLVKCFLIELSRFNLLFVNTHSCLSKIYTYFKLLIVCFNIYISKQLKLNYVICNDICLLFMFSSNETLPLISVVSIVANML